MDKQRVQKTHEQGIHSRQGLANKLKSQISIFLATDQQVFMSLILLMALAILTSGLAVTLRNLLYILIFYVVIYIIVKNAREGHINIRVGKSALTLDSADVASRLRDAVENIRVRAGSATNTARVIGRDYDSAHKMQTDHLAHLFQQLSNKDQMEWIHRAQTMLDKEPIEHSPQLPPKSQERWINVRFVDHPRTRPLDLEKIYTIAFNVDITQYDDAVSTSFDESRLFQQTEEQVKLAVCLSSKDFTVYTQEPQNLFVPRTGKSKNTARFDIEPRAKGIGEINVNIFKENNFIQGLTLKVAVEEPGRGAFISIEKLGRPIDGAFAIQPRDVSLVIKKAGEDFILTLADSVYTEATLHITLPQLNSMINRVRKALHDAVYMQNPADNSSVYLLSIDIPSEVNQQALQHLARAGFDLYQDIFYNENADAQANLIGDKLRELSQRERLRIQIVSQQFLLPWGLIYPADTYPEHVDPEMFLGLKHIIEHIPLQQNMQVLDNRINSHPNLNVSLNVNTDIDQEMSISVTDDQLKYWQKVKQGNAGVQPVIHSDSHDVLQDLIKNTVPYQILYFYCHAVPQQLDIKDGADGSYITLSSGTKLTLGDLKRRAPIRKPLLGAPLVFLNACGSAELSPLFYGGFMPYFTAKGARGMIGAECDVPALFAATWAERFFNHFLQGHKSLGEIFLALRCEFYYDHNNFLGLLYALYCDGDTRVVPGLQLI